MYKHCWIKKTGQFTPCLKVLRNVQNLQQARIHSALAVPISPLISGHWFLSFASPQPHRSFSCFSNRPQGVCAISTAWGRWAPASWWVLPKFSLSCLKWSHSREAIPTVVPPPWVTSVLASDLFLCSHSENHSCFACLCFFLPPSECKLCGSFRNWRIWVFF